MFRGKSLESIAKADLESLITDQQGEGQRFEYKSVMYGNQREEKIKMLKDITAMANAEGGFLIIGISEDGNGRPQAILGVENGEVVKDSILKSCNSSIDDKILGLRVKPVDVGNGKHVLLISIPNSTRKPHIVTFDRHNKFYIRHDRHNLPMSLNEIRGAILTVEGYMEKHLKFLAERKQEIKEGFGEKMVTVFYATPIILGPDLIDCTDLGIHKLIMNPELSKFGLRHWLNLKIPDDKSLLAVEYHLHGITAKEREAEHVWFDVYRKGHFEMRFWYKHSRNKEQRNYLPGHFIYFITQSFMAFVSTVKSVYQYTGLNVSLSFSMNIYNCKDIYLGIGRPGEDPAFVGQWKKMTWRFP